MVVTETYIGITDPAAPPTTLPSGEPDWSKMPGTRRGRRHTKADVDAQAELLTEQSLLMR